MRGLVLSWCPAQRVLVRLHGNGDHETTEPASSSNKNLFQGDIMLTEDQRRRILGEEDDGPPFKNAQEDSHWPDGIIPYEISGGNSEFRKLILDGIKAFNDNTCLKFMPRKRNDTHYIKVRGDGDYGRCSSFVGQIPENAKIGDKDAKDGFRLFDPKNGQSVWIGKYCTSHPM